MNGLPFGRLLASLRTSVRPPLSQARLARWATIDNSSVSRMESGDREPSREMVYRLAGALRCSDEDRDRLLMAAGFVPVETSYRVAGLPPVKVADTPPAKGHDVVGFEVIERTRRRTVARTIRFYPVNGTIFFPLEMAKNVGINGHAQVLWDRRRHVLGICPATEHDRGTLRVRPATSAGGMAVVQHVEAIRTIGITHAVSCPAHEEDGMIVCTVGEDARSVRKATTGRTDHTAAKAAFRASRWDERDEAPRT